MSSTCRNEINYSQITGDRILPFLFSLNLEESILYPEQGQNQRFCYDIEGVGQDAPQFADLSHFLLGICSSISQTDIIDISVILNGQPQMVVWGENVEIKTLENPDNPTGCVGLKFDFPLDKVDGTMKVCFSLSQPYTIGGVNVCVFGGNTTATGLAICGPACGAVNPCESVFYQKEQVCVPVTVTPFATPGTAKATCCGEPVISTGSSCPGSRTSCSFTVTQTLCIEIPISFGAAIETGATVVQCGEVSRVECDCSDPVLQEFDIQNIINEEEPSGAGRSNADTRDRRFFNR